MKGEFYKKKLMLIILMLLLSSVGKKTFAVRMYASLHEGQQLSFLRGGDVGGNYDNGNEYW